MDSLDVINQELVVDHGFVSVPESIKGDFVKVSLWKQGQIVEATYQQVLANGSMIVQNKAETDILICKFGIGNALLLCVVIGVVFLFRKGKR